MDLWCVRFSSFGEREGGCRWLQACNRRALKVMSTFMLPTTRIGFLSSEEAALDDASSISMQASSCLAGQRCQRGATVVGGTIM